jgi:hypothetical protein
MIAIGVRVARVAGLDRVDAGLGDVFRRVEVRFADRQADDVLALGLECGRTGGHGEGRGGLDALDATGDLQAHDTFSMCG